MSGGQRWASGSRTGGAAVAFAATAAAALVVAAPGPAHADFEQELVRRVMHERRLTPLADPATAQGLKITRIEVAAVPVFTPADPIPDMLNVFHVTTQERVVRNELLFAEGDEYDEARVEETARNLRAMVVLTTAAVVPFLVEEPGGVGVLVITKDIWSLRHGFVDLFFDSSDFWDSLRVRGALTEMNLFGLNKSVALKYARNRYVKEIGQSYLDRRIVGSRWQLYESVDALFDNETDDVTARGDYQLVRPFFSLDTRFAGQLSFQHDAGRSRALLGNGVASVTLPPEDPAADPADPASQGVDVPHVFDRSSWGAGGSLAWQSAGSLKHRVGLSLATSNQGMTPVDPEALARRADFYDAIRRRPEFSNVLGLSWSLSPTDFHRLRNADVYGITEDFVSGPSASASVGLSSSALGSDNDFARFALSAGWRIVTQRQAVFGVSVGGGWRRQKGVSINKSVGVSAALYTPATLWGRLVWKGGRSTVRDNRHLGFSVFGGDGGLRGHPVGALRGDNSWRSNLEWRSLPLYWKTYQLGAAVYFDSVSAWFEGADEPPPLHGVGVGLRYFLPQFNHRLVRLDLAAPPDNLGQPRFVFSFDQAF